MKKLVIHLFSFHSDKLLSSRQRTRASAQSHGARPVSQKPSSSISTFTEQEAATDWGREDRIALGFAHELDLYQAIHGFKRSSFLLPPDKPERRLQLEYDTMLCYYYGRKYPETIYTFNNGPLRTAHPSFTPYQDLLVMLYDSYNKIEEPDSADKIMNYMEQPILQSLKNWRFLKFS